MPNQKLPEIREFTHDSNRVMQSNYPWIVRKSWVIYLVFLFIIFILSSYLSYPDRHRIPGAVVSWENPLVINANVTGLLVSKFKEKMVMKGEMIGFLTNVNQVDSTLKYEDVLQNLDYLKKYKIYAPFSGIVSFNSIGEIVNIGDEVCSIKPIEEKGLVVKVEKLSFDPKQIGNINIYCCKNRKPWSVGNNFKTLGIISENSISKFFLDFSDHINESAREDLIDCGHIHLEIVSYNKSLLSRITQMFIYS